MDDLNGALDGFVESLAAFSIPPVVTRSVGELLRDTNWPWGYEQGLYCFVSAGEVVYVGRAIGATLGSRIWSQLKSLDDPAWAAIATDERTSVLTLTFESSQLPLVAALELYLIAALAPSFNLRAG